MKKLFFLYLVSCFSWSLLQAIEPTRIVNLYSSAPKESNGYTDADEWAKEGTKIHCIATPRLDIYYPADVRKPMPVLLSIPGGGYKYVSSGNEGEDVAAYFCPKGIAVAVLKYRLPNGHENIPLADACRAVELLRDSAAAWNMQADKIGVMGFSAGGHLTASLMTKYTSEKARPNYGILIYPVICSDPKLWHKGSFEQLLGPKPSKKQLTAWSIDKQVTAKTPPCLIVACEDDKTVPVENSIRMYQALRDQKVTAQLLLMPTGGHGWGFRKPIDRRDLIDDAILQFIWTNLGDKKKQTLSDIHKNEVRQQKAQKDWAKYTRYQSQNDSIITNNIPVKAVFLGNSITDHWGRWRPEFFAQYHCAARGISAQTTYQMLARMQADVIALKPEMVFILAGANDMACNDGPISDENLIGNIRSMCELAVAHGIRPMLCSILPHRKFYWNTAIQNPNERVIRINTMLKAYAERNGFGYVDYYSAMLASDGGGMREDLTPDEVHPYKEAYQIMEDIVRPYISE